MVGCAVKSCRRRQYKGSGIHFFSFPTDPVQRKVWMSKTSHFNPTAHSRVCSVHFEDSCFEKDPAVLRSIDWKLDRPKIKADAVPTMKLDIAEDQREELSSNRRGRVRPDTDWLEMDHGTRSLVSRKKINRIHKFKKRKCEVSNFR